MIDVMKCREFSTVVIVPEDRLQDAEHELLTAEGILLSRTDI